VTKSSPTLLAALPVKDLANAKQRLMSALTPDERHDLAAAMLEDVLDALAAVEDVAVLLVTKDPEVLTLASRWGTPCLTESANRGHTEAVALGQRAAAEDGFARFLTLPGDVPCASAEEIRALIAAVGDGPGVAFVPSLSGFGTNAALLAPPGAMPLKFGEPSFANHLDAARARGLVPMILELPGIGLDVDAPEDLRLLLARGPRTRAGRLLHARGIAARLTAAG
jgi:2-phospho-L-lactate/phosphoenolpyruvate guanylyltransferase